MDLENNREVFGVLAVLLFGAVIGGGITYQHMDDRITALENEVLLEDERLIQPDDPESQTFTSLFQEVEGSVVSISSTGPEPVQGSGFVYSEEGYIVTNYHVIEDVESVRVGFTDGEMVDAEIVGYDIYSDLAVLRVDRQGLDPLELADSEDIRVGEQVIAIGNPFGLSSSMTTGIVSQKERLIQGTGDFSIPNVIQTDAAINPGNSGGPLLNARGDVVGVNTAIETRTGVFSGVGLAIPSNTVDRVVPEIIEGTDYQHPWIGVSGHSVDAEIADAMDLEEETGFMVAEVDERGPAAEAGIQPGNETSEVWGREIVVGGDVIIAINGEEMEDISDILLYLEREAEVGETVDITVLRDGETVDIPLTLQDRPRD